MPNPKKISTFSAAAIICICDHDNKVYIYKDLKHNMSKVREKENSGEHTQHDTRHRRIFNFLGDKGNQPLIANLVAIGILIVTAILAWYTYRLYRNASEDSATAKQSATAATTAATIAQKTFKETKKYNDSSLKIQRMAFNSNNLSDAKREKRDSLSLNAQIASLKETQMNFDVENKPYVQLQSISIDSLKIGYRPIIKASIVNLGKSPAKIFKISFKVRIDPAAKITEKEFTGNEIVSEPNVVIANNAIINMNFLDNKPLPEDQYGYLTTGRESFFINGTISYLDFLNGKTLYNKFIFKISLFPSLNVIGLKNDIK